MVLQGYIKKFLVKLIDQKFLADAEKLIIFLWGDLIST